MYSCYEIGEYDADTSGAFIETVYYSGNCILVPVINIGISEHELNTSKNLILIDYSYILIKDIEKIYIEKNGIFVQLPHDMQVKMEHDEMCRGIFLGGTSINNINFEISVDQTNGLLFVKRGYRTVDPTRGFYPLCWNPNYNKMYKESNDLVGVRSEAWRKVMRSLYRISSAFGGPNLFSWKFVVRNSLNLILLRSEEVNEFYFNPPFEVFGVSDFKRLI